MTHVSQRWDEARRRWRARAQRYKGDPLGAAGVLRRRLATRLAGVDIGASVSIEYSLPVLRNSPWLMQRDEVDDAEFATCPEGCPVPPPLSHVYAARSNYVLRDALVDTRSGFVYVHHLGRYALVRESTSWPASQALWAVSRPTDGSLFESPLAIVSSPSNYFHFMTEDLPALLRARDEWPNVTVGVHRGHRPPYVDAALDAIGVQAVELDRFVRASVLHLAGRGQDLGYLHPTDRTRLQRALSVGKNSDLHPSPAGRRVIFASRGLATRSGQEEHKAQEVARHLGAEVIDFSALSLLEQSRVAFRSSVVIGSHGAALTNALFCPPGSMLVELVPPGYHNRCYEWLAHTSKLRYEPAYSLDHLQATLATWANGPPA